MLAGAVLLTVACGVSQEELDTAKAQLATGLVAEMVQNANVNVKDGEAIAHYMMAILHGADPLKEP